jgi:hypothetical protein
LAATLENSPFEPGVNERRPATFTSATSKDGKVISTHSGNGSCAEGNCVKEAGGIQNVRGFSKAFGFRRNRQTDMLEYKEIPVCIRCQSKYDQSMFPEGTQFEAGGAWSKK